jgi:hypothetical protein
MGAGQRARTKETLDKKLPIASLGEREEATIVLGSRRRERQAAPSQVYYGDLEGEHDEE